MIETDALTSLENFYRQWYENANSFLDGVVTRSECKLYIDDSDIPDSEKLEKFPDQVYYPRTDNSYIEKEIRSNLLIFSRDGLEYTYLQRLDTLYGNIESASNVFIPQFNHVHNRVNLGPAGKKFDLLLFQALSTLRQLQYILIKGVQESFYVSEHPEKFPYLGPSVKMFHQAKTQFAKDPNKAGVGYQRDKTGEWAMVNNEPEPVEPDKKLTAAQKLLFIRLLQEAELFPRKPSNTDDAPEQRAIALLTELSYENDIKGSKGANIKVNQLLNSSIRESMTPQQAKSKLLDLEAVGKIAQLLHADKINGRIDQLRKDLNRILEN